MDIKRAERYISGILKSMSGRHARTIWLLLFLVSLCGMIDIPGAATLSGHISMQIAGMGIIAAFKASVLLAMLTICRNVILLRFAAIVVVVAYAVCCIANGICYGLYGFGISHKLVVILAQTTVSEVLEFLPGMVSNLLSALFSLTTLCVLGAVGVVYAVLQRLSRTLFLTMAGILSAAGCVLMVWLILTLPNGRSGLLVMMRTPKSIVETIRENRAMNELIANMRPLPDADKVQSGRDAALVVMIIGESASRQHLSIYGYPLATSPQMAALGDSLLIFSDAISSSVTTAGNMERILSFKPDDTTNGDWMDYPLLIDLFRAAGYRTYWLSNQERTGIWSNCSGAMSSRADEIVYAGCDSSEDAFLLRYDEVLLPYLRAAVKDTASAKFIGMHLLGSHTSYANRFPPERRHITGSDVMRIASHRKWLTDAKARTVADYDNSIRYTDSIVCEAIRLVRNSDRPGLLVYFSDHGEHVYDSRDFVGRDIGCADVPFVVYVNDAYRAAYPEKVERLKGAIDKPISTANIIYPLMTLTGVRYPYYNAEDDFLSPQFVVRKRYVDEKLLK